MAHKELQNGPLALRLEKAPRKCFSSPAGYLQHLLDTGYYPEANLAPEGPLACGLEVPLPLPRAEDFCSGEESEFFIGTRPLSRLTRSRTQLRIKSPSPGTGSRSLRRTSITGLRTSSPDQDLSQHLLYACAHDLPTGLQLVLNSGCGLNLNAPLPCTNRQGLSPLAVASLTPTPFCCELLIKAGADVNWTDDLGRTAFHWAVLGGQVNSVKVLLKHSASARVADREGFTPLLYAVMVGDHDITASLLKEDSSLVNQQHGPTGVSPLMLACAAGRVSLLKLLLKHNADASLCDSCSHYPIHCGAWGGNTKCLLATIPSVLALRDQWGRSPLMLAAAKGDTAMCQHLLKKGSRLLAEVDRQGRTSLHWAILSCQASCVQFLLDYTSEGNHTLCSIPDTDGAAPVHYAATTGSKEILLLLKSKGASVSVRDHSGYSPLLWAAACGRTETVQVLLEEDAETTRGIPSGDPTTALQQSASATGRLRPLHAAACTGALEACQLLLRGGAEANAKGPSGQSPLHYACRFGHTECVSLLLSAGASVDTLNQQQESGLHLAAIHGYAPVVRELLASGALKDKPLGEMQDCPVHLASLHGHHGVLEVLLDAGSGVDPPRLSDSRTPLQLSSAGGHLPCSRLLLAHGADTGLRDCSPERLTALDLALLHAHTECAALLVAHGAPTAGGRIHRAAATIQAVWRFHRYKRRREITQQWAAVVLQRAVRGWLGRARARRVRGRRERARHRAATLIQYHWRLYSGQRRRYETSYARLRARLEQEHLATSIILTELHSHTHSISLPSAAARARALNPKALLKAASSPLPIFPSSSLLFPSQPRRPLIKKAPLITTPGGQARTPLITTAPGGPPLIITPERETRAPVERKASKKQAVDHMSSPFLPTIHEAREEEEVLPQPRPHGDSHLPALPSSPSLTAGAHLSPPLQVDSAVTTRGSPKASTMKLHGAERAGKPRENIMQVSKSEAPVAKPARASKISVTRSEPAVGTARKDKSHADSELRGGGAGETPGGLPPINQSDGVVSAATSSVVAARSSTRVHVPKLPLATDDLGQQHTHSKRGAEEQPAERAARTPTAKKGIEKPPHRGPVKVWLQSQSHITRQTAFRDAPQGYKEPGRGKRQKEGSGAADMAAVGSLERDRKHKPQDAEGIDAPLEQELLHQAKRYDKLNQVLALLEQARGDQEAGGEGGRISELKDHIKTALDEAIRLRADTDALQTRAGGSLQTVL